MNVITVRNLTKKFQIYKKAPGFFPALKSFFSRKYQEISAVNNISFNIREGELIGFIGPNGAGKTTTLKCLSGLIYPTNGDINVLGYDPFERKDEYLKKISLVMGQKNQLWWDLPAMETFRLNKEIYGLETSEFEKTLKKLQGMLNTEKLSDIPVRKLSLGERMRMELIAALLHKPKILYLDEPTIGLDVVMQKRIRDFILEYNQEYKAAIILTSHYMADVKKLCKRIIILDKGRVLYDGNLQQFIKSKADEKILSFTLKNPKLIKDVQKYGQILKVEGQRVIFKVKKSKVRNVALKILNNIEIEDLNIEDPEIDDIIRDYFNKIKK